MSMKSWKLLVSAALIVLVFAVSCAPAQQQAVPPKTEPVADASKQEAASKEQPKPKPQISDEVKELLERHKTKAASIYYKYRGPQTGANFYEFYVKGAKIKYKPYLEIKTLDRQDSYDSIFIDKEAKTSASYCLAAHCLYPGKKADLDYREAYIETIFDWIDVDDAKKAGEEVIDSRSTWKIDTNKGIVWVDTFYGIPLKAESDGKTYKFEQISVNNVKDSDVAPS